MSVNIPPDVVAEFEDFWDEMLQERFGSTPPTPQEEAAFIQEFLDQGIPTVPLPGGRRVDIVADGGAGDDWTGEAATEEYGGDESTPLWQYVAFVVMIVGAIFLLVDSPFQVVGNLFSGGGGGNSGGNETPIEISLPEGIDSLVRSGDVRAPLVTPRTLEIQPSNTLTSTTFIVVPVEVEEADWPCPTRKFKGQPAACWVFGTVVNYLVGIPNGPGTEALFEDLRAGGDVRLRMSTENVLRFTVDEVQEIERHQTEVLGQHHFGLTLVALGGEGPRRYVARASYIPEEIAEGWEIPEGVGGEGAGLEATPTLAGEMTAQESSGAPGEATDVQLHTVTLGERVVLSEMVSIVPVGSTSTDSVSRLRIALESQSSLPYTPRWVAEAETDEGEVVTADVTYKDDQVIVEASAPAAAWVIEASGHTIRVNTGGQ
jgi:hypothetical protein